MKICFSCNLDKYKPKGNVLQFLILLKALDKKIHSLPSSKRKRYQIDCVLPFTFTDGEDKFSFRYVRFHSAEELSKKIIKLDQQNHYDKIFIRGRKLAQDLIKDHKTLDNRLMFLATNYNLYNQRNMKELNNIVRHSKIVFFQTIPIANRYKNYLRKKGIDSKETINQKFSVLPQFVEDFPEKELQSIKRSQPLHIIQAGVIRPRYGLPTAVGAIELIRKAHPNVNLNLLYPSIVNRYRQTANSLMNTPGVINHGQRSMWETKKMIVQSGIGLALIYDTSPDKTPSYAYLSRILEYLSLGVPVLTTKTKGNMHLLGKDYPLFVQDELDIYRCYQELNNPVFYDKMSSFVRQIGKHFIAENAVNNFWSILHSKVVKSKL